MKHKFTLFTKLLVVAVVCMLAIGTTAQAQLITENFSYTAPGTLKTAGSANWTTISGTDSLRVTSGSLSYAGFPASGIGNKVTLKATTASAEDDYRGFTTQTSGTTYMSFLMNVTDTLLIAEAATAKSDYFIGFLPDNSTSLYIGRVMARKGSAGNTFQVGLLTNTSNTVAAWSADLTPGTTYLVVISYQIVSGAINDIANMWINPALGGTEPTPQFTQTSAGTDAANIGRVFLRQGSGSGKSSPNVSIDGIMVGTTWESVTPFVSSSSDIVAAGNETANIDYASYQLGSIGATTDAVRVWSFTIRDGGGSADADAYSTVLNSVTISQGAGNPTWATSIRQAALYNGSTEVAEVSVTGETITFSGLSGGDVTAADDGSTTLDLYVTFESNVTDNSQYQFEITNANVSQAGGSSAFSAFSAQTSSVTGDANRVEVTASKLTFTVNPPASVAQSNNFSSSVAAQDALNNTDVDYSTDITIGVETGSGAVSSASGLSETPVNGVSSWTDLQYNTAENGVVLNANAGVLTEGLSTSFDVVALSAASDIVAGAGVEPATISSLVDTEGEQVFVFDITVRDGGGSPDGDAVGTKLTTLYVAQGTGNTAADWNDYIQGAVLYNGITPVDTGSINSTSISFSGEPIVEAPDDGEVTLSLKIYLNATLPAGADGDLFNFKVNHETDAAVDPTGSLFAGTGTDVEGNTAIDVVATALHFAANIPDQVSGVAFNTAVNATDANENVDEDLTSTISLTVSSGSGSLAGSTSVAASAGVATFTGVILNGAGDHVIDASDGGSLLTSSNIFAVDSSALFKVANYPFASSRARAISATGGDTLSWDDTNTWTVLSGYDANGIPDANDDVVLDNDFKSGSYVVRFGPSTRDTARSLTIGYTGNPNTIEALIPTSSTLASQFVIGDNVAGNYDLVLLQGGVLINASTATSGNPLSIRGFSPPNDTISVRTGGRLVHATVRSASYLYRTSKVTDGDYGIVEYDIPGVSSFFVPGSGAYYPNLVFSPTNAGGTRTYTISNSADPNVPNNPLHCKGDLTINVGATLIAGSGGFAQPLGIYGDLINYGTYTSGAPSHTLFMGNDQQSIIGNAVTFENGLVVNNVGSYNVDLQTNVIISGGTATMLKGTLVTGANTVYLDPAGSLNEDSGVVSGTVSATRTVSQGVSETFGDIGFEIEPLDAAPGVTTVLRTTGSTQNGNGNYSIRRYFDVTSAGTPPYNAEVTMYYNDAELNGNNESDLFLHKSTDAGTTWSGKTGQNSTTLNRVITQGISDFSRFTLASAGTPLFTTHSIMVFKYEDTDGALSTAGTKKRWYLSLYENSIAPGNLVKSENNDTLTVINLAAGTYIAVEADSAGWVHAGHIINNGFTQDTVTNTLSYDTITVSGGVSGTFEFYNSRVSSITMQKFRDRDGNPATTGDQTAKSWGFALYRDTVGGTPVAEGEGTSLVASDLASGTYIAVEADSAGWYRCNGDSRYDTLVLAGNSNVTVTFINVKANTLHVRKYQDNDGDVNTTGDQELKAWYFDVFRDSLTGAAAFSGSGSTISNSMLPDGIYYAVEADSSPWVSLGYKVDGVYAPGSADTYVGSVELSDGQTVYLDFFNAPPIYGANFRAFNPDSLVTTKDNFNKVGKSVKKKADKVQFEATLVVSNDNVDGLFAQFTVLIDTTWDFYTVPPSTITEVAKSRLTKFNFAFGSPLANGSEVKIYGYGKKGSVQKIPSYWWTTSGTITGSKKKNATVSNTLRLPMPNALNVMEETFAQGAFTSTGGMVIGVPQTQKDSIKKYGWVLLKKSADALKTLSITVKKVVNFHDGTPRGLDSVVSGKTKKSLVGKYTSLQPTKQDNILYANLVALKLSIAASALDKTPVGFGELILNDTAANPLNGMTLAEISRKADTMMTGYPGRTFEDAATYLNLSNTIRRVLDAFQGPMDTSSFGSKLSTTGAARLIDCKILKANPSAVPYRIIPSNDGQLPEVYALHQNYPNPFNPATTIEFDLPIASIVTLKIYNILGQEVATLLDHQELEEGSQGIDFNAANYSSGVYLYRITAESVDEDGVRNSFTSVKKMMLMK